LLSPFFAAYRPASRPNSPSYGSDSWKNLCLSATKGFRTIPLSCIPFLFPFKSVDPAASSISRGETWLYAKSLLPSHQNSLYRTLLRSLCAYSEILLSERRYLLFSPPDTFLTPRPFAIFKPTNFLLGKVPLFLFFFSSSDGLSWVQAFKSFSLFTSSLLFCSFLLLQRVAGKTHKPLNLIPLRVGKG